MNKDQIWINAHLAAGPQMDLIAELGVGGVRLDFNWYDIEPEQGRYDFSVTEASVQAAKAYGLGIYATLSYAPRWANGGRERNYPARNVLDWLDFVFETVSYFAEDVPLWGLWNEPNSEGMFAGSVTHYVDSILIPGGEMVRAANPGARICGPELAHMEDWRRWQETVLRRAGKYIDVVTHHCYERKNGRELYREMESFPSTEGRPLWVTETGYRSDRHGEEGQADRYDQLLEAFPSQDKIAGLVLFDLQSEGWGIVRDDLSKKPAYDVIKNRIRGGNV
jgi:hypothetical protein